jgi:DeoR/GlpR family transcriptional regulator of sugar metabolism
MLAAQRREFLLARLGRDQRVVAKDVAAELGVSEDSVRRDLRDLAAAGLCQRVYGGALPASPAVADYTTRRRVEVDSKQRVAAAATALVKSGDTLILDGGTTALAVARALPADLAATVVTHSPTVAVALAEHPGVEIYLLGGRLFRHSMVTCGAAAAEAARAVHADLFLLGVTGVHPGAGAAGRGHVRAGQCGEDRYGVAVHGAAADRGRRDRHRRPGRGRHHAPPRRGGRTGGPGGGTHPAAVRWAG